MPDNIDAGAIEGTDELLCIDCGYNLHGIDPSRDCPECGTPVASTMRGDLLRYADAGWLDRLRRGSQLIAISIVIGLIGAAVGMAIAAGDPMFGTIAGWVVDLISTGLWIAGLFYVTTPEPRANPLIHDEPVTLRRVMRVCALLTLVGTVINAIWPYAGFTLDLVVVYGLGVGTTIASVVAFLGLFVYFRRLARRIPDRRLARDATVVMWGFIISYIVLAGGGIAIAAIQFNPATPGANLVIFAPICAAAIALLVFSLRTVMMLGRFSTAFTAAQRAPHVEARLEDELKT